MSDHSRQNTLNEERIRIAIQALWLQYNGLTIETVRTGNQVENAAWKNAPPHLLEDLPGTGELVIAT